MAKWANPSDETHDIISEVLQSINLDNLIRTKIIVNDDQSQLFQVKKETAENLYAYGYDLKIIVNESIFDRLPDAYKILSANEALAGTYWNYENDKLVVNAPDKVYKSFIEKHGWEPYERLIESIRSLYEEKKNEANAENVNTEE